MPASDDTFFAEIEDDPRVGGKARSLARLAAAGLPTPAGFVVTDALLRGLRAGAAPLPAALDAGALAALAAASAALAAAPWPAGFLAALAARLDRLGATAFAVRSSFAGEDEAGALAAGVYESRVGVAKTDVPIALREVLDSALAPGAVAYALGRGRPALPPTVAVLIHAYVAGDAAGGAAFAPGMQEPLVDARTGTPSSEARSRIAAAASQLAVIHGGVELEWAAAVDEVTFLQLRPYAAPPPPAAWPGLAALAGDTRDWRWDAAHNPLPLTPAHAGLVAYADARCRIGIEQRVLGGYLFWAPGGSAPSEAIPASAAPAALDALALEVEAGRARLGDPPALEPALALFAPAYERLFGVIQPAARRARAALAELLAANLPEAVPLLPRLLADVESRAAERRRRAEAIATAASAGESDAALARYLELFGDEAPAWDVAEATHRERPTELLAELARPRVHPAQPPRDGRADARAERATLQPPAADSWTALADGVGARLPAHLRTAWRDALATARAAVAVGEDDDWLYARLQAPVRQALLALGRALAASGTLAAPDDVFFLPLELARALATGVAPPADLRARAEAGRADWAEGRRHPPPLAGSLPAHQAVLRGAGTGGRALGRVVLRHGPAGAAPPPDAILVATSLLPTELPLLRVAALVTDTGGPLDHVATQARERRLPAVVGVAGATAALRDGDLVLVDADQGLVILCSRTDPAGPAGPASPASPAPTVAPTT